MALPDTGPPPLASYGSLAPGRVNHNQLAALDGHWQRGTLKGRLVEAGWGTALGYPALVLDSEGPEVEVFLFESKELPDHWSRLDEFEGNGYRRVAIEVHPVDGELSAYLYVVSS
jgi:gamma-glutamylcyclotransferase (GGCT)/AIG2-like uncharacterized protein YtfP